MTQTTVIKQTSIHFRLFFKICLLNGHHGSFQTLRMSHVILANIQLVEVWVSIVFSYNIHNYGSTSKRWYERDNNFNFPKTIQITTCRS